MIQSIYFRFILSAGILFFGQPGNSQTKPETIDELLKIYSRQGSFNGTALVANRDSVVLVKGYGFSDRERHRMNTAGTAFSVGSLTKPFTALLILMLQEKHLLSVNDKLSAYLPVFPNADKISILQLLTHSSGMYNISDDSSFMLEHGASPISVDELISHFSHKPFYFEPGTDFRYCNSGYIILGKIIELITHTSYFQAMHAYILDPLHMRHSGFDYRNLPDDAKSFGFLNKGNFFVDSSVSYAAGALYSTASDMYLFDRALYGGKLLADSSIDQMFHAIRNQFAVGWFIDTSGGLTTQLHEGDILGFSSIMVRIPQNRTFILLMDNVQKNQPVGLAKIAQDINAVLTDQPYDWPVARPEISMNESQLREYTGAYLFNPQLTIVISLENGQLFAQTGQLPKTALFAEKLDLFFTKLIDSELEFTRDADGRIKNLKLTQGTESWVGRKVK